MLFLIFPAIHALLVNADCYSRDGTLSSLTGIINLELSPNVVFSQGY